MKELTVKRFKAGDLHKLNIQPEQRKELVNTDLVMTGEHLERTSEFAWTVFDPEPPVVILFCAGLIKLWPGTGELWLICDVQVKNYVQEMYGYCKHLLEHTMDLMYLVRAQTKVQADWQTAIKFAERMGFEREGLLKKFKDGADYFMYARVR